MTNVISRGGGTFEFTLTNHSGWDFSVLVSTNLADWTDLPNSARPVFQFDDPAATNGLARFHRLQWP